MVTETFSACSDGKGSDSVNQVRETKSEGAHWHKVTEKYNLRFPTVGFIAEQYIFTANLHLGDSLTSSTGWTEIPFPITIMIINKTF